MSEYMRAWQAYSGDGEAWEPPGPPPGTNAKMPTDVTNAQESPKALSTSPQLKVVQASQVTLRRVVYVWQGRIPRGAMTLMPGEEGIGKSTVSMRLISDITRGKLPGEYQGSPKDVVIMATEDGLEEVVIPRMIEAGADLTRVHFVAERTNVDGTSEPVILPRDLELLDPLLATNDVAMVYIDSLATTLPDELKAISYKDVAKAMKALGLWAEQRRVALVAPWHLNKSSGSDTALRIMDSRAFRTGVRSMLLIVRDPDAPEGHTHGIVALDKSNAGSLYVPALRYRIRSASYSVQETDEETGEVRTVQASCGVAEWMGEVEGDGRDVARALLAPKLEQADDAKAWLRKYLSAKGPVPRSEVIDDGREAGHSDSAIKRAARQLHVHSAIESGQHPDSGAPFKRAVWSLPKPQSGHQILTDPDVPTEPSGEG